MNTITKTHYIQLLVGIFALCFVGIAVYGGALPVSAVDDDDDQHPIHDTVHFNNYVVIEQDMEFTFSYTCTGASCGNNYSAWYKFVEDADNCNNKLTGMKSVKLIDYDGSWGGLVYAVGQMDNHLCIRVRDGNTSENHHQTYLVPFVYDPDDPDTYPGGPNDPTKKKNPGATSTSPTYITPGYSGSGHGYSSSSSNDSDAANGYQGDPNGPPIPDIPNPPYIGYDDWYGDGYDGDDDDDRR